MITALGELIEAIDIFVTGLAGWRYILSPSYRRQTHHRWKQKTTLHMVLDILGSVIGIFFTVFLVGLIGYLIL